MRWLKRLGLGCLVLAVVVALLWTVSRLRGPTPAQRAALAQLEAPNAFEGRNAFDAIWVLRYDVPETEISAVADTDMQAMRQALGASAGIPSFTSAAARYPDLQPRTGAVRHCSSGGADCLSKVSAAYDDYAALVEANARLIERVDALAAYDHHAWRLPYDQRAPLPPLALLSWPVTSRAVEFVRGDRLSAVDATCRNLAAMRRIGASSDTLIVHNLARSLTTNGYGALLASMFAELPRDAVLPPSCELALAAPAAQEASVCPPMKGELAWATGLTSSSHEAYMQAAWNWLFFEPEQFRALLAEQMAAACAKDAGTLQRDMPFVASGEVLPIWQRLECVANIDSCLLIGDHSVYLGYSNRALDHRARLQLLAALVWLRGQPDDGTLEERLARLPQDLRSPARDITVTGDGQSIEIAQYDTSRGATWSLPLPPYLVESPTASD
ncbi:hypothetical protein AO715_13680 [Xanthomonas sp. Mitacek01]|nr:hypothetical protein AO715_13680 [Xanthomonas sp. Mitacek01]